jgi:hypothetical protein
MARISDHLALKDFEKPFVEAKKDETALQNFTGIKIGDVNGSAAPEFASLESRSVKELNILFPAVNLIANQLIEIPVFADMDNIEGLQGQIKIDHAAVIAIKEKSGLVGQSAFKQDLFDQGILRFSWVRPVELKEVTGLQPLFTMYIRSAFNGKLENTISILNSKLRSEAYTYSGDQLELDLAFKSLSLAQVIDQKFVLTQNAPNPFNESTVVRFTLPIHGKVNWSVSDMAGRVVTKWSRVFV